MKMSLISLVLIVGLSKSAFASETEKVFGADFDGSKAVALDVIVKDSAKYLGADVVATAQIEKVCQSEGCWFEAKTAGAPIHVNFKDHGFTIPKDSYGRTVKMSGRIIEKTQSVAAQKHYLKDAKASKAEIEKVKEPKKTIQFEATGVKISG